MPSGRVFRTEAWRIIAICFAAFLFSFAMRLIEVPRWDQPSLQVDGEWLLATNDAYFWVAGAEGVNTISEPMPMSVLLAVLSRIFPIAPANLAFWASILLAALVAIPIALWAYFLGAPLAALLAPVLVALAPAFYNRTRLGFYDTDWATLFFPLLIGWLLAVWIQPRLQGQGSTDDIKTSGNSQRRIPILLILVSAFGVPWHNSIGLFLVAQLGLAAVLVAFRGRPETRSGSFLTFMAIALAVGAGWIGALMGLLLLWRMGRSPAVLHHPWAARSTLILLSVLLVAVTGIQFQDYLSDAAPAYMGKLFGDSGSQASGLALLFPSFAASVRETQKVDLAVSLGGMAFHPLAGAVGVLGYFLLLRKKPVTVFLLPLLLLGLGALRLGIRFTMFAAPVVLLGLLVPLDWISAQAEQSYAWGKRVKIGAVLILILILTLRMDPFTGRTPVDTVVGKDHAEALNRLGEVADPAGTIWTWWDYGYASQHFAGLETFADGRRLTGDYLFSLGTVLGSDSFDRSAEFMHFSASHNNKPWDVWDTWRDMEWDAWLDGLGKRETRSDPSAAPQFLVVLWEGIPALPWIQYFGSWDFETYEGQRSRVSKVARPLELELETGRFRYDEDQSVPAVTVDLLGNSEVQHFDYAANAGGPHILVNDVSGEVMLLDETAYRSTFIQLLITPVDQLDDVSAFSLLIDNLPFVRVFELR